MEKGKGLRFNKGKINLSYCPTSAIAAIASTLQTNSEESGGKYPRDNWRKGMSWTVVINCLMRHLEDFRNGVDIDPEDGIPTIWKVATNAAFLVEYTKTCPELDDRFKEAQFALRDFPEIKPVTVVKEPQLAKNEDLVPEKTAVKCIKCFDTGYLTDCCSSSLQVYNRPCPDCSIIYKAMDKVVESLENKCNCGMVCNCDEKLGTKQCGENCKCK